MFPDMRKRIGATQWRVILEDRDHNRCVVVLPAASKASAQRKARAMWVDGCWVYDCSPVSGFDPRWFDVPWSD